MTDKRIASVDDAMVEHVFGSPLPKDTVPEEYYDWAKDPVTPVERLDRFNRPVLWLRFVLLWVFSVVLLAFMLLA